ncbi:hypothetical protein Tsubulata_026141 [Turnera subulata]|uniref:F-box domain-containing protein n=1 Tax=Turnera subulata TaxID=218843 RepID=A0A9Q0FAA8_9ROSI|nr:hypothetical protein Tsubulata_026141 [Turnera subulata]
MLKKSSEEANPEAPIHGDILDSIITYLPLIHLVPTSQVSKSWNRAVSTSIRVNRIKPWLFLHTQKTRPPYSTTTTTHAFDPRSHLWIKITRPTPPPPPHTSPLRSSHSTLLYMLSPFKFSFSTELHAAWHTVDAPAVWRTEPVVALVGHHVVVAGGGGEFEDDPMSVEMLDTRTGTWDSSCPSMPEAFQYCKTTTWLSVAADSDKMYVTDRSTGTTHVFCPNTKTWHGPYTVSIDNHHDICNFATGFAGDRLILVGVIIGEVEGVKLWELKLNGETSSLECFREIGEMPKQLVEEMINEDGESFGDATSVDVNMAGDVVYVSNKSNPGKVFLCEIGDHGGACDWRRVPNVVVDDDVRLRERVVLTCSNVGLGDLHRAMVAEKMEFSVK